MAVQVERFIPFVSTIVNPVGALQFQLLVKLMTGVATASEGRGVVLTVLKWFVALERIMVASSSASLPPSLKGSIPDAENVQVFPAASVQGLLATLIASVSSKLGLGHRGVVEE